MTNTSWWMHTLPSPVTGNSTVASVGQFCSSCGTTSPPCRCKNCSEAHYCNRNCQSKLPLCSFIHTGHGFPTKTCHFSLHLISHHRRCQWHLTLIFIFLCFPVKHWPRHKLECRLLKEQQQHAKPLQSTTAPQSHHTLAHLSRLENSTPTAHSLMHGNFSLSTESRPEDSQI